MTMRAADLGMTMRAAELLMSGSLAGMRWLANASHCAADDIHTTWALQTCKALQGNICLFEGVPIQYPRSVGSFRLAASVYTHPKLQSLKLSHALQSLWSKFQVITQPCQS